MVSHNVLGDKQLFSRYKGFRAELLLEEYLKINFSKICLFQGGLILSKDNQESSLNNALYVTVVPEEYNLNSYLELYDRLSGLDFEKMYLVVYSRDNWTEKLVMEFNENSIYLPVPDFKIYTFNIENRHFRFEGGKINIITDFFDSVDVRKSNKYPITRESEDWLRLELNKFSESSLQNIYVNRLILDGYIGFGKKRGKISDVDLILRKIDSSYRLVEIKEKDLPKKAKKGFGLDVPRINDLRRIELKSGIPYQLIIRQVNNQKDRNLIAWKYISITDFIDDCKDDITVNGGTGMRSSYSSNPTLICSYHKFKNL